MLFVVSGDNSDVVVVFVVSVELSVMINFGSVNNSPEQLDDVGFPSTVVFVDGVSDAW